MSDDQNGGPELLVKFADQGEDFRAGMGIEIAGGLIGKEHRRLECERAGDGDALALAAGKLVGEMVHARAELDQFQQFPGTPFDLAPRDIEKRARELLELVQLGARLDHLPDELSGGERQRVAIARALAFRPPVLLADEPTGNLDTHTGAEILALIRGLHRSFGSTILIVTHDVTVAESCPRMVTLRDARIAADIRR